MSFPEAATGGAVWRRPLRLADPGRCEMCPRAQHFLYRARAAVKEESLESELSTSSFFQETLQDVVQGSCIMPLAPAIPTGRVQWALYGHSFYTFSYWIVCVEFGIRDLFCSDSDCFGTIALGMMDKSSLVTHTQTVLRTDPFTDHYSIVGKELGR